MRLVNDDQLEVAGIKLAQSIGIDETLDCRDRAAVRGGNDTHTSA